MRQLYSTSGPLISGEVDRAALIGLYRHPAPEGRVWLRTNFVASLDGSVQGPNGRAGGINTPSDQDLFALHRALADVVLVGAGTARVEGYRAVDLAPWQREIRREEGLSPFPVLAIVSESLRLDPAVAAPAADHGSVIVITRGDHPTAARRSLLEAGVEVVPVGSRSVDLPATLALLASRGQARVLCEGGPRLHAQLLAADLVDEMSLSLAPVVVLGEGPRTTSGPPLPDPLSFELRHILFAAADQTLFTSYRRRRS